MSTQLKKTAIALTQFVLACILLSTIGCKKEARNSQNDSLPEIVAASTLRPEIISTNQTITIDFSIFIPCANGGTGENVQLSGSLHQLYTVTMNGNNISLVTLSNPQGISGAGDITGDKYQATGITEDRFTGSLQNGKFEETFTNNFRIIGKGPGNNFLVHETYHVTVNASGVVTTFIDNITAACK